MSNTLLFLASDPIKRAGFCRHEIYPALLTATLLSLIIPEVEGTIPFYCQLPRSSSASKLSGSEMA